MGKFEEEPVWLVIGKPDTTGHRERAIFSGSYNKQGTTFTIRRQYSGNVVARAGGGGYDRQHTALADAIARVFGLPMFDGGAGFYATEEWANSHGVAIYDLTTALFQLPGVSCEGGDK